MAPGQYDLSREEQRILEEKAKRRAALRQEYIKQVTNPHRHGTGEGGYLFDTGIQRFMSMRTTMYEYFKPSPKSSGYGLALLIVPLCLYTWLLKSTRDAKEKKYRTGQVAYSERNFKFQ